MYTIAAVIVINTGFLLLFQYVGTQTALCYLAVSVIALLLTGCFYDKPEPVKKIVIDSKQNCVQTTPIIPNSAFPIYHDPPRRGVTQPMTTFTSPSPAPVLSSGRPRSNSRSSSNSSAIQKKQFNKSSSAAANGNPPSNQTTLLSSFQQASSTTSNQGENASDDILSQRQRTEFNPRKLAHSLPDELVPIVSMNPSKRKNYNSRMEESMMQSNVRTFSQEEAGGEGEELEQQPMEDSIESERNRNSKEDSSRASIDPSKLTYNPDVSGMLGLSKKQKFESTNYVMSESFNTSNNKSKDNDNDMALKDFGNVFSK